MSAFARGRETIPAGYAAVAVDGVGAAQPSPLRMCVVVRRPVSGESQGGHLVEIRQTFLARVFLGCILDARGTVLEWMEWWVQQPDAVAGFAAAHRQRLDNSILDRRWIEQVDGFEATGLSSMVCTGWERENPFPVWIDLNNLSATNLPEFERCSDWRLCRDDAALAKNGLPPYGTSCTRYLYDPAKGVDSLFVAMTRDALEGPKTRRLSDVIGAKAMEPFNAGGALVMARCHGPMELEACSDVIAGQFWPGLRVGRSALYLLSDPPSGPAGHERSGRGISGNRDPNIQMFTEESDPLSASADGMLLLGSHSIGARAVEALHLKLRLVSESFAAVKAFVSSAKRPLLNLSLDSFRVWLDRPSSGLPYLWTARPELVDPGDAVGLPSLVLGSQFVRGSADEQAVSGFGSVRIREVKTNERGITTLDLSFAPDMATPAGQNDLVYLRLSTKAGPIDIYARPDPDRRLASSEWRLMSAPYRFPESILQHFQGQGALPAARVPFELITPRSTACDLRDLGVVAVRVLLTNETSQLRATVDELLSLARQLSDEHDARPLVDRIEGIFERDTKWAETLGPHRLRAAGSETVPSAWPVPIRLWAEVLASIIRMFPGIGPDSLCPDLAYVPAAGLETVFDATLSELSALLTRTRSLMLGEWQVNEEVRNVIRRQIAAAGASGGTSQGMGEAVHRRPPQSQAIPRPAPSANMTRTR